MITDHFHHFLVDIGTLHHTFAGMIDAGFLVLARILGFVMIAPLFGRKDIPFTIKMGEALILSAVLVWMQPSGPDPGGIVSSDNALWFTVQILVNVTIGLFIGFIATMILETVSAAGFLMNNQVGLSSAMMFDPSSRQQVGLTEKLLAFLGFLVFLNVGGLYWIISALQRSFEVFPLYSDKPDFLSHVSLDYLVTLSGNTLEVAVLLVAPVFVVTLAVDTILGVINRTAQQIQVFQLSFGLKPSIGFATFLAFLPLFFKLVENYFTDHANIF